MQLFISLGLIASVVIWGLVSPATLDTFFSTALAATTRNFGWFSLWLVLGLVVLAFFLAFSRYGDLKLGAEDDEQEFSVGTWFAMLFAAGMGIGLVFWGVAEPISHYANPPPGVLPGTPEAASAAMRYGFFHWGVHPWAIYGIVGLAIAFFSFRRNASPLVSSVTAALPWRAARWMSPAFNVLALVATAFGVAASLGMGATQIDSGFTRHSACRWAPGAVHHHRGGHARLRHIGCVGTRARRQVAVPWQPLPRRRIGALRLRRRPDSRHRRHPDQYPGRLHHRLRSHEPAHVTIPAQLLGQRLDDLLLGMVAGVVALVGLFIARISRGRTIRQFILGTVLAPTLVGFVWFAVFGGAALNFEIFQGIPLTAAVKADVSTVLFVMLDAMPGGGILSAIATLLVFVFFVTSGDSATLVLGTMSTGGNPNPPARVKVIWGVLVAAIALSLLLVGGIGAIQTATIVFALPFSAVLLLMAISLTLAIREDWNIEQQRDRALRKKMRELVEGPGRGAALAVERE